MSRALIVLLCLSSIVAAQPEEDQASGAGQSDPANVAPAQAVESPADSAVPPPPDKRIFGVVPNYRTAESARPFQPLTVRQKFMVATKDSFDYPVLLTTSLFAGLSQLEGSDNDVYGQGMKGFGHRYAISYADQVIGNYFPEFVVPSLLHLDPRYYRKGEGSKGGRLLYAMSRIFVAKKDNGRWTFNYNEFLGNALASATTLSYHTHERTLGDAVYQMGFTYMTSDMIGQVMKEFWPDVKNHFKKHKDTQ